MKSVKPVDSFPGHHCLIAANDDNTRMTGLQLDAFSFRRIARMITGSEEEMNDLKNIEVKSIKPTDFTPNLSLWHVRVGNAIFNIHHRHVEFYFDLPIPKRRLTDDNIKDVLFLPKGTPIKIVTTPKGE